MKHGLDMPILNTQCTLLNALIVMTEKKIGLGIIVDSNKLLAGIITDGDIRRYLKDADHDVNTLVSNIMNRFPETAYAAAPLCRVLEQMVKHPLTDRGIAQFLEDAKKIPARK